MKNSLTVIMPTCNRYDVALQNLKNLMEQKYENLQIIVCDDSDSAYYRKGHEGFKKSLVDLNASYIYCARFDLDGKKDYGLARCRNMGIIESNTELVAFMDDRITTDNHNSLEKLVFPLAKNNEKIWAFGDKGAQKKSFVENFSVVRRAHIVNAGMFLERIDKYGGMTREIFNRCKSQGFKFLYVSEAKAKQVCKSSGWDYKPSHIEEMKNLLKKIWR